MSIIRSRTAGNLGILFVLVTFFIIATVKLFGTTVSSKFSETNMSVAGEVDFGGPSTETTYAYRPSTRSRPGETHAPSPLEPVAEIPVDHKDTRLDATSTFAIDVDTGSYTLARRSIEGGWMPSPDTVRVEEFVNYFTYAYPQPDAGHTARVEFEAAPSPFSTDGRTHLLRVGLQAGGVGTRPATHLTFLVDVSGSMGTSDRLPVAREAIKTTVSQLGRKDRVAIVTYSGRTSVVLKSTPATRRAKIFAAVDRLSAGGATAMGSGMQLAYDIARQHAGPDRVSRVVVMSDGDANIGSTHSSGILSAIRAGVDEGVTMSTVGFGTGNYDDAMMEQLADAGDGNYTYIDSADEVPRVFADRLESLLHVVAKDVKVQIVFDADAVESWRQIGYENRQLADHQFRDDRVDAGEMGAGHQVTALYEVRLKPGLAGSRPIARARFRHKKVNADRATEVSTTFTAAGVHKRLGESSGDLRFQAAVAAYALYLRGSREHNLDWIEEVAGSAHAGRADRLRFLEMVRKTAALDNEQL